MNTNLEDHEYKSGDIFFWKYSDEYYDKGSQGTCPYYLYHCKSQICVYSEESGMLRDTYWNSGEALNIRREEVGTKYILKYVGNFRDLVNKYPEERAYYLDKDCVNLNHKNNTSGNFYIRKGAKKSVEKMKKVALRNLTALKSSIEYQVSEYNRQLKALDNFNEDSRLYVNDDVNITDTCYTDENNTGEPLKWLN